MRVLDSRQADVLLTHQEGEVILSGKSTVGYLGFDNETGKAKISFGYPFVETPKRYIRKLTLVNPICTFAKLEKGEQITLTWLIHEGQATDYGQYVADTWNYCFDRLQPKAMQPLYSPEQVKARNLETALAMVEKLQAKGFDNADITDIVKNLPEGKTALAQKGIK
jgi:hypothetical protein